MVAIYPDLAGKVVLVTGGASGIGEAIVPRLRAPEAAVQDAVVLALVQARSTARSAPPLSRVPTRNLRELRQLVARRATCDHKKRRTRPVLFSVTLPVTY